MGLAIIIPEADFSQNNLGRVTFSETAELQAMVINGPRTYEARTVQLSVRYLPLITQERGCTWAITSDADNCASIGANTGVLTINSNGDNSTVVVRATSTENPSVYADATFKLTYKRSVDILNNITDITCTHVGVNAYQLSASFDPENTSYTGVTWAVISGGSYVTIDSSTGAITVKEQQVEGNINITVRATSQHDPTITYEKQITVAYVIPPTFDLSKYIGAIDMTASGLGAAMNDANAYTILVELSPKSGGINRQVANLCIFSGSSCVPDGFGLYPPVPSLAWISNSLKANYTPMKNAWGNGAAQVHTRYAYGSGLNPAAGDYMLINKDNFRWNNTDYEYDNTTNTTPPFQMMYLTFGFCSSRDATLASGYATAKEVYDMGVSSNFNPGPNIKLASFIIVPGTYATMAEVKAARANAWVDIQFDQNLQPYNAGSCGTLMLSEINDL
ncbi:hypothetical protein [Prevotella sp. E2-28]|uniref:hypothetical protein n=1 Tax=Prevotella sp. E2-28 TaxID=2913620 RepID=UPI001EDADC62|nr:hypothetical protein [Prevotella sp. E2-28]UKK52654.1 hypothetical protein L6465_08550 [Prevotella sp. E2-28]